MRRAGFSWTWSCVVRFRTGQLRRRCSQHKKWVVPGEGYDPHSWDDSTARVIRQLGILSKLTRHRGYSELLQHTLLVNIVPGFPILTIGDTIDGDPRPLLLTRSPLDRPP